MDGEYEAHCAELERQSKAFAEVVGAADPATPIPTCPGWTMTDLVRHHGTSQRRVDHVVRHLSAEPVWAKDVATGLPPRAAGPGAGGAASSGAVSSGAVSSGAYVSGAGVSGAGGSRPGGAGVSAATASGAGGSDAGAVGWSAADYAGWFATGAARLLETLRAADPAAEVWTNGRDQHVRYWARRILFEAVVHRADAELAVGATPQIADAVAADGVDELLANLAAFPWVAERQRVLDPAHVLRFETGAQAWTINPVAEPVEGEPTATVRAAAGDLLLLVYGRIGLEDHRFAVTGDRQFLGEWLAASAL